MVRFSVHAMASAEARNVMWITVCHNIAASVVPLVDTIENRWTIANQNCQA